MVVVKFTSFNVFVKWIIQLFSIEKMFTVKVLHLRETFSDISQTRIKRVSNGGLHAWSTLVVF